MTNPSTPRSLAERPLAVCSLLAVATAIAFWPVVNCGFINYDDPDYVSANARVQLGLTWKNVAWAFVTNHASNWHPLTWLSHMLDTQLLGKSATGPHCVNLLFHIANTGLLFFLLRGLTRAHWRPAVVAALFALHPLHVESVAWIAERKDVLSTFFGLLALGAYAGYVKESNIQSAQSKVFYALALLLFALSLMSKPMLVTLPFVMLLLDLWPLRRFDLSTFSAEFSTLRRLVWEKAPFLLVSAAGCVATLWAQTNALQPLAHMSLEDRVANAFVSYCRYLGKTIWPEGLAVPYLNSQPRSAMEMITAGVFVFGLSIIALFVRRRFPFLIMGWLWFLGMLIPVIGLVQVGMQSMADRYTYMPLIGLFIVLVWGAGELCVHWRLPGIVVVTVALSALAVCGVLTQQQVRYWRDSETLFKHTAAVTQNNFIALGNVGGSLFARGRLDEAMDYYQQSIRINPNHADCLNSIGAILAARESDEAMEWFRKTLVLQPNHADALFNMGNALAKKGNSEEAVGYFLTALKIRPDNFEARNNLGNALVKLGRFDEATTQYRLALEYKPDAATIHKNLGEVLAAKGELDQAILHYRKGLMQTNDPGTHYSLGLTLAVQGKWDAAIKEYIETLRLSPANAEAHYNLGYAFRVQGRLDQAVIHLEEALRLKPEFPLAHYNVACALVDKGERSKSIAHLREALRLKPDYKEAKERLRAMGVQPEE